MPDNWGFVLAAYGLAAIVLGGYWRRLVRHERDLAARSRVAPTADLPRPTPASRPPLQS